MKKFIYCSLIVVALALIVPVSSAKASSDTIFQGVFIGDVDVSGLSKDDAQTAVNNYIGELGNKNVTLKGKNEEQSVTVKMSELGLGWANPEVVDEAYALGRAGNIIERYKAKKDLQNSTKRFNIEYSFNDEAIYKVLEVDCASFNVSKINYKLSKEGDNFIVSDGRTGYLLDERQSLTDIKSYIQNEWTHDDCSIDVAIVEDKPLGSEEELSMVKDVLGTFTTNFRTSGSARSANVANGCSLINGTTLYPGEELSVLDKITPFTEANGYFPAGSYLNGLVVESVGGGICQVSTTLYNAVLGAELEVTERHNHSMIINYVDPSMDAAIAESGGKNFRFVNSTEYPIYIEGYTTSDKNITFTIYGVETRDPGHKVEYKSEVLETIPAGADQIVADAGQPIGAITTQAAHIGYKAQLWKITYENGVETGREVVNSSNYKMVPRIITVGTATGDPTQAAQIATAIATGDINQISAVAGAIQAVQVAAATEGADVAAAQAQAAAAAAGAEAQLQAQQAAQAAAEAAANPEAVPAPAEGQTPADNTAQTPAETPAETSEQTSAEGQGDPAETVQTVDTSGN